MLKKMKGFSIISSILILGFFAACSTPELAPTPTDKPEPEPTPTPVVETEFVIINNETVVESITLKEVNEETGEILVSVEGHTLNSCTSVDGVTITQDGDVFMIDLETSVSPGEGCIEESVQFDESAIIETDALSAGVYLVSSGTVGQFEVDEKTAAGEAAGEDTATTGEASTTEEAETQPEPEEVEPRDCVDSAVFLADVTIPDNTELEAGEAFTKTWSIQNTGTCTWGPGYELDFVSGEFSEVVSLEDPFPDVEPAETVELSVGASAPTTADIHKGAWVIKRPEGDNVLLEAGDTFDLWVIVIVASESTASGSTRIVQDGVVCAESKPSYENEILQLINEARADEGLAAYELQPQLTNAARKLSTDMACNDFVSQTGSDGTDWYGRISAEGYTYSDAAEIIFSGTAGLPELAFNWWVENISLSGNILDTEFTQIGIAYALNPQNGESYYTVVFASP